MICLLRDKNCPDNVRIQHIFQSWRFCGKRLFVSLGTLHFQYIGSPKGTGKQSWSLRCQSKVAQTIAQLNLNICRHIFIEIFIADTRLVVGYRTFSSVVRKFSADRFLKQGPLSIVLLSIFWNNSPKIPRSLLICNGLMRRQCLVSTHCSSSVMVADTTP